MAVPQNKVTKSRRDKRRSHDALTAGNPTACPECGESKLPHHVCKRCGSYAGREVVPAGDELRIEDDAA